jgi:hypothetical protein
MSTDQLPEDDGPAPGDPRDTGPRPHATPPDLAWAALAALIAGATVLQLIGLVLAVTRPGLEPGGVGLFLGFLVTVVWLLTVYWVVMGAWRRSVWGCPFRHDTVGRDARRCPRHHLVTDPRTAPGSGGPSGGPDDRPRWPE